MQLISVLFWTAVIIGCLAIIAPALSRAWAVVRQPTERAYYSRCREFGLTTDEMPSPQEQAYINRQLALITSSKEA